MNLSAPFILRPIATSLLMAGLLLCGLTTYPLLPVGALPNFNYPTIPIQISAQLPGADPQTRALALARGQQPKAKISPAFRARRITAPRHICGSPVSTASANIQPATAIAMQPKEIGDHGMGAGLVIISIRAQEKIKPNRPV